MFFNLNPATLIARIIVLIVAFTVHEFAHAWTATRFGDETPRLNGRLSLNPLVHLDPMGSLVLLFAGFGWAKPVPVNPYALQKHSSSAYMWVAFAGPLSNLLLAVVAAIPFRLGWVSLYDAFIPSSSFIPGFSFILLEFISINILLMLFNMIPIAPLDGEKVVSYFLPQSWSSTWDAIRPYGPMILILLIFVGPFLGYNIVGSVISPAVNSLTLLLIG
jgi:Zn-dependent protease